MTIEEVVDIAKAGALQGCTEALFTLGEAPCPEPDIDSRGAHSCLHQASKA